MKKYLFSALVLSPTMLFAQSDNESGYIFIGSIIGFVIAVFVTRAIFSIGTIVKNLKTQTELLAIIANRGNENKDEVSELLIRMGIHEEYRANSILYKPKKGKAAGKEE